MASAQHFIASEQEVDQRLDIFLSQQLHISRSQAQKIIDDQRVTRNNILTTKPAEKITAEDRIALKPASASKKKTSHTATQSAQSETDLPKAKPIIIADTNDYLVINKPTGMLTHPTMAEEKNTLVDFVVKKYPRIKKIGDDPARPGIVHRLDKEASGLIVVAKNQKMFDCLKEQFKNRTIEKQYLALVHGKVAREWGEINFPIARSESTDRMAALPQSHTSDQPAKEAKTEFWIEKQFVNFTLLRVKIYTGRTHQIRVHFLAYNHPLVGDPLYMQKKQKRTWDNKLGRLFLHSALLGFTDLDQQKQTFESSLPDDLASFLTLLR